MSVLPTTDLHLINWCQLECQFNTVSAIARMSQKQAQVRSLAVEQLSPVTVGHGVFLSQRLLTCATWLKASEV